MTYLISSTGLTARIHELPGREPFMLAVDLADAYGTETENLTRAVKRNPVRFPEDFAFRLSTDEMEDLRRQNGGTNLISSMDRTAHLAFAHAGALALSGVLKTPVAAEVSVIIHRTFAAMEQRAFETMRYTMIKLQSDAKSRSALRVKVIDGTRAGLTFHAIWRMTSASQVKLAQVARDCLGLGLIEMLPAGTPPAELDLFAGS